MVYFSFLLFFKVDVFNNLFISNWGNNSNFALVFSKDFSSETTEDLQMPSWYSFLGWEWLCSFAVYNYPKAWPMGRLTSLGDLKVCIQGRDLSLLYCTVVTEPGAERDWFHIPLLRYGKRKVLEEHEFWVMFDFCRMSFRLFFLLSGFHILISHYDIYTSRLYL